MRIFMKEKDKYETWEYKDIEKVCIISELDEMVDNDEECLLIKQRQYPEIGKLDFRIQAYYENNKTIRTFALETEVGEAIVSTVKGFPVWEEKVWKFY